MSNREIVVTQNYLVKKQTDKNPNFSASLAKLCYESPMYFIKDKSYIIMRVSSLNKANIKDFKV